MLFSVVNFDIMKYDTITSKRNTTKIWTDLATRFNLSFSKCISIGNKLLGFDRIKKRLLVSPDNKDLAECKVIDLHKIKTVSVKKSYDSIKAGELTNKKIEEFLKHIHLRFEYLDSNVTVFPLYERGRDNIRDVRKMDLASKSVQGILSKLILSPKTG
jgi:hypothetical protein